MSRSATGVFRITRLQARCELTDWAGPERDTREEADADLAAHMKGKKYTEAARRRHNERRRRYYQEAGR